MKFEIETYKGQLIEYDDDYDKFVCDISIEDNNKSTKRMSLSDIRKEIDQFIKANVGFKPFKVFQLDKWNGASFKILNVSAIRTDGKFVTHTDGSINYKSHSGKEDTESWRMYDVEIVKLKEALEKEQNEATEKYKASLKQLCTQLQPIDLSKYEHIINTE